MKEKIKTIIGNFKNQIKNNYQDRFLELVLFGSQAREDAIEGSDIDIMVVLKDEEVNSIKELRNTIDIIASLSLEFNEVITCFFVSEKSYKTENSPLLLNVRRDGVIL